MNRGEYIGENFKKCKTKILILGESHHDEPQGEPVKHETKRVVNDYLRAKRGEIKMDRAWYFFTKIAHAFDCHWGTEEVLDFWSKVCFRNYIDVNCGVKSNTAKKHLSSEENRAKLNNELFNFINNNNIDCVVCLGKLVYNNLPSCSRDEKWNAGKTQYRANIEHQHTKIFLKKDLEVISLPHPSGFGFKPADYNEKLNVLLK